MRQRNQSGTTAASTTGILKATINTECMNQDENTEILSAQTTIQKNIKKATNLMSRITSSKEIFAKEFESLPASARIQNSNFSKTINSAASQLSHRNERNFHERSVSRHEIQTSKFERSQSRGKRSSVGNISANMKISKASSRSINERLAQQGLVKNREEQQAEFVQQFMSEELRKQQYRQDFLEESQRQLAVQSSQFNRSEQPEENKDNDGQHLQLKGENHKSQLTTHQKLLGQQLNDNLSNYNKFKILSKQQPYQHSYAVESKEQLGIQHYKSTSHSTIELFSKNKSQLSQHSKQETLQSEEDCLSKKQFTLNLSTLDTIHQDVSIRKRTTESQSIHRIATVPLSYRLPTQTQTISQLFYDKSNPASQRGRTSSTLSKELNSNPGNNTNNPLAEYSAEEKKKILFTLLQKDNPFSQLPIDQMKQSTKSSFSQDKKSTESIPRKYIQPISHNSYVFSKISDTKKNFFQNTLRNASPAITYSNSRTMTGTAISEKENSIPTLSAENNQDYHYVNSQQQNHNNRLGNKNKQPQYYQIDLMDCLKQGNSQLRRSKNNSNHNNRGDGKTEMNQQISKGIMSQPRHLVVQTQYENNISSCRESSQYMNQEEEDVNDIITRISTVKDTEHSVLHEFHVDKNCIYINRP